MKRIIDRLYVGTIEDVKPAKVMGFSILGACKDPLHRQNARVTGSNHDGYIFRSMPKNEPEYLYAKREHALYCNLIDAPEAKYISDEIIDAAISFLETELSNGKEVIVVCNHATSRSPSIVFMYMIRNGYFDSENTFFHALRKFMFSYCPSYNPGQGFLDYITKFWRDNHNVEK